MKAGTMGTAFRMICDRWGKVIFWYHDAVYHHHHVSHYECWMKEPQVPS